MSLNPGRNDATWNGTQWIKNGPSVPTSEQLRTAHYAACAAKETAEIAAFVALPAAERNALRGNAILLVIPLLGFVSFFFFPILATLGLPITLGCLVGAFRSKYAPTNAPSEEEIFRAEVLKRI